MSSQQIDVADARNRGVAMELLAQVRSRLPTGWNGPLDIKILLDQRAALGLPVPFDVDEQRGLLTKAKTDAIRQDAFINALSVAAHWLPAFFRMPEPNGMHGYQRSVRTFLNRVRADMERTRPDRSVDLGVDVDRTMDPFRVEGYEQALALWDRFSQTVEERLNEPPSSRRPRIISSRLLLSADLQGIVRSQLLEIEEQRREGNENSVDRGKDIRERTVLLEKFARAGELEQQISELGEAWKSAISAYPDLPGITIPSLPIDARPLSEFSHKVSQIASLSATERAALTRNERLTAAAQALVDLVRAQLPQEYRNDTDLHPTTVSREITQLEIVHNRKVASREASIGILEQAIELLSEPPRSDRPDGHLHSLHSYMREVRVYVEQGFSKTNKASRDRPIESDKAAQSVCALVENQWENLDWWPETHFPYAASPVARIMSPSDASNLFQRQVKQIHDELKGRLFDLEDPKRSLADEFEVEKKSLLDKQAVLEEAWNVVIGNADRTNPAIREILSAESTDVATQVLAIASGQHGVADASPLFTV